jgi:hypothetical protein
MTKADDQVFENNEEITNSAWQLESNDPAFHAAGRRSPK